jgi:glucokinase
MKKIISADIGGSHISVAAVDMELKKVMTGTTVRQQLNSKGGAEEILNAWASAVKASCGMAKLNDLKISLAMPGPFDYERGISYIRDNDKYESIFQLNVKDELGRALNIQPNNIRMKNDAACFLQGEVIGGAARGFSSAIGITLGTGLGSAIFKNGIAEDAERWQQPFKDSIADNYFSTRWFLEEYRKRRGRSVENVKSLLEKHHTDGIALSLFEEFACNLSSFLIDFARGADVKVIVIGGNISHASEYFFPHVSRLLAEKNLQVEIRKARLGEFAAILGAASCWDN